MLFLISKMSFKFIDYIRANGQAKIATWSFNVNKLDIQRISLNEDKEGDNSNNNSIEPGSEGEFNIKIDAENCNVNVEYLVKFENETKKPTNLKFMYNENIFSTLKELEPFLNGKILKNDEIKEKQFNIKWNWAYETGQSKEEIDENDRLDTEDAKNIKEYSFDVIVEGIQLEPQKGVFIHER